MPDQVFENPRLTAIYDSFDGSREDLNNYLEIAKELKAKSVLDIGSGTGCFASLLSQHNFNVVGLEPAQASLKIAQQKPYADRVNWILGDSSNLSGIKVDLAIMTGNVAQVFIEDKHWEETLVNIRKSLHTGGHLVFEVRDPKQKAWLEWNRNSTYKKINVPSIGNVEAWCEVTNVSKELVSFRWTYIFESDGKVITSDSTLRFRDKDTIIKSLAKSGYTINDIRDAPDRPGKEFVFVASCPKIEQKSEE